jgi:hypothetical protein
MWPEYDPTFRVATQTARRINNMELLKHLREFTPGHWKKIYQYGQDARELHFFRHKSGYVAYPKWK